MSKRWNIVNKKSGKTRRSVATREIARTVKNSNERIFDTVTNSYVR